MLIRESDVACKNELRMNRHIFNGLCERLKNIRGLTDTQNMPLEEIVVMFVTHYSTTRKIGQLVIISLGVEKL